MNKIGNYDVEFYDSRNVAFQTKNATAIICNNGGSVHPYSLIIDYNDERPEFEQYYKTFEEALSELVNGNH